MDTPSEIPIATVLHPLVISNRPPKSDAFGLISLRGSLSALLEPPKFVQIKISSRIYTLDSAKCVKMDCAKPVDIIFHVVTQMLPNGPIDVDVVLWLHSEVRLRFPLTRINVMNTTTLAGLVGCDLFDHGTSVVLPRELDSRVFPYESGRTGNWVNLNDDENTSLSLEPSSDETEAIRHLKKWGFCLLPNIVPSTLINEFLGELDSAISNGILPYEAGSSQRIHNAHRLPSGREIWLFEPVIQFLKLLFNDEPCACQTLTYIHGSEQRAHQDTIHLTPFPIGCMCGVWIALEDIREGSGELIVFPGSHKLRRLRAGELGLAKVDKDYRSYSLFEDEVMKLILSSNLEGVSYLPRAGQILIWHENLIHGGCSRRDRALTRRSIVSHYFSKGAVAYYDSRGEAAWLEACTDNP